MTYGLSQRERHTSCPKDTWRSFVNVGSIVRARHWHRGEVGIVVNTRIRTVTVKVITPEGIMEIDQLASDLEVIA